MERIFDLDLQLLADTAVLAVNVFILFVVMSYFLFNPVREMLKKRQDKIANDLSTAKQDREDALALKEDYDARLKNADKEVEQILAEARKKAMKREEEIIAQAKEEAAKIIQRAKVEVELEQKRVIDDMKREMVQIASVMAGKVVAQSMDTEIQNGLIEETLKEMGENTWLS